MQLLKYIHTWLNYILKGYLGMGIFFFYPLTWHGGPDGEVGMLTDIMISVLKMSIDEKSIKAVFVSLSVKKRKKFARFSVKFIEFYVYFYTN